MEKENGQCGEENTLLNAIKNKFATANGPAFNAPTFVIPNLKTVPDRLYDNASTAKSGELFFGKLSENIVQPITTQLQNSQKNNAHLSTNGVDVISSGINTLAIAKPIDNSTTGYAIDLTAALSNCTVGNGLNEFITETNIDTTRKDRTETEITEVFDIPFIDCDKEVIISNDLCCFTEIDKENTSALGEPSSLGRFFNYNPENVLLPHLSTMSKPKYEIKPFLFNTPSPDDIFKASIKFNRKDN